YYIYLLLHYYFSFLFSVCNASAPSETYTLSLHDALPILKLVGTECRFVGIARKVVGIKGEYVGNLQLVDLRIKLVGTECRFVGIDRKSTRLNSSHVSISYAVFCLKKKKNKIYIYSS